MVENIENLEVINFTNIDSEDYVGMWGGKQELIKAGQTKPYPRFLAEHYAFHLAQKILLKTGKDFGDKGQIAELIAKILGQVSVPSTEVKPEETKTEPEFEELKEVETPVVEPITPTTTKAEVFKCNVCGKEFKAKIALSGHLRGKCGANKVV